MCTLSYQTRACTRERERERERERAFCLSGESMTGRNSLFGDWRSVDAKIAPVSGQEDPFILTLRQASNGGEDMSTVIAGGNSIKEQDFTSLAISHESPKVSPLSGFPLCKMQVNAGLNSGDVSCTMPVAASGCREGKVDFGCSQVFDMEPGIAQENVDLALSIVPYMETVTTECAHGNGDFAGSCTPQDSPTLFVSTHLACPSILSRPDVEQGRPGISILNNPSGQQTSAGFYSDSNIPRYVCDPCLPQHNDANQACHNALLDNLLYHSSSIGGECLAQPNTTSCGADGVCLNNIVSHGRVIRQQSFSASSTTDGTKIGDKNQLTGLPLPDSLARSFDSSEMDKIAKAIVRVNEFGSCLATNDASKHRAFVQEPGDGNEVGSFKKTTPKVLPSVGAFTVQCAKCFKWRLVPSKEQYEQIRQQILEKPFFCSSTSIWQPGASCDDPPELCEDTNFVWAIDKPNIPLAPSGWERLLVIRSEGCSKFADIYYVTPSGKKLRSMPDIERYLLEHPELVNAGVNLSQFSFVIPRALDKNYCRRKPSGSSTTMRGSITHKSTPTYNLGVRPQSLKVSHIRKFPVEHFNIPGSAGQPPRQPVTGQSNVNGSENAPLIVEPLRAWDAGNCAMMVACHAGTVLESPRNDG